MLGSVTTLIDYGSGLSAAVRDDLLQSIREEAERLSRYVGDLLDMTRLEGGALVARRDWLDARDVLRAAVERVKRRMGGRKVAWDFPDKVDRKSTRLNSSHVVISYAVFCLKKKRASHSVAAVTS